MCVRSARQVLCEYRKSRNLCTLYIHLKGATVAVVSVDDDNDDDDNDDENL